MIGWRKKKPRNVNNTKFPPLLVLWNSCKNKDHCLEAPSCIENCHALNIEMHEMFARICFKIFHINYLLKKKSNWAMSLDSVAPLKPWLLKADPQSSSSDPLLPPITTGTGSLQNLLCGREQLRPVHSPSTQVTSCLLSTCAFRIQMHETETDTNSNKTEPQRTLYRSFYSSAKSRLSG